MLRTLRLGIVALSTAAVCTFLFLRSQPNPTTPFMLNAPLTSSIRAPEFPSGADWLNTDKPLSLRGLKGKIVLLDFWTYCCINCMHVLPDLKKLEETYPNELVVVGVHSGKFDNENDTKNIRNAILRYKITHPVINDPEMQVWDEYTVRAWPTFVLINPNGYIVNQLAGEGHYEVLNRQIGALVTEFKKRGELNSSPLKFALEAAQVEKTPLRFPGKVLAEGNKLFVADSNYNRIIVSDLSGNVQAVFGSGAAGLDDGPAAKATFRNPQGMALSENGEILYVADTDNHALRALNLKTRTVSTLAGTGKQAAWRSGGGIGTKAALASPWDVLRVKNALYIAMAGSHQIWELDLASKKVEPCVGTGAEARYDASLMESALAQPSGLATDGKRLYFADSESSSIRAVDFGNDIVSTLVGGDANPRNLFAFGDKDGTGFEAKLQHPLGVAFANGKLYVADTYNHKIKVLEPQSGQIESLPLNTTFNEPGGISAAGNRLFVADTNSHKIKVVDLNTNSVSDLTFKNLPN